MMKLGIIGAENSHTIAIARELNIQKVVGGFGVTHVWGETAAFARKAAEAGQIPNIVRKPEEMLGEVDCVMVDHRHGKYHLKAVTPFVKARIPVFVDKPMSTSLSEAKSFLKLRKRTRTPVTTMSAIPHQACVKKIRQRLKKLGALKTVHLNGPGDPKSKYGGVFFYGIHQVDLMVELFGTRAVDATTVMNGGAFTGVVSFPDGLTVTISMPGIKGYFISAVGSDGSCHEQVVYDKNVYLATTRIFTKMFKTRREPFSDERMLAPVAVLEAFQQSLTRKARVKVRG